MDDLHFAQYVEYENTNYSFIRILYETLVFSFIVLSATGMGFLIISHCIYNPMLSWGDSRKIKFENEEYDDDEYRYKYFDELDQLCERKLSEDELEELKNKIVNEKTPKGEVILFYNKDTETFFYYCQSKEIGRAHV